MTGGYHETELRNEFDKPSGKWDGNFNEMNTMLDNLDDRPVQIASNGFRKATGLIFGTNQELLAVGYGLADAWKGETAGKVIAQLEKLWNTSNNLMGTASMLDTAFGNYAGTIKDAKQKRPKAGSALDNILLEGSAGAAIGAGGGAAVGVWGAGIGAVPGAIIGGTGGAIIGGIKGAFDSDGENDENARKWINEQLTPAATSDNGQIPAKLRVDTPTVNSASFTPPLNNSQVPGNHGSVPGGKPGGSIPHGGTPGGAIPHDGTHGGALPGPGGIHGGNLPGHGGSDLAGLHPGGSGGGLGGGLDSPGGGLGGGPGGSGGGLGGGLGGSVGGAHGGLGLGRGNAGQSAAEEAATRRVARVGKGGTTANGMPIGMGGAAGGQEEERERTTWLTEDESVWGGDDDAAPPIVG